MVHIQYLCKEIECLYIASNYILYLIKSSHENNIYNIEPAVVASCFPNITRVLTADNIEEFITHFRQGWSRKTTWLCSVEGGAEGARWSGFLLFFVFCLLFFFG